MNKEDLLKLKEPIEQELNYMDIETCVVNKKLRQVPEYGDKYYFLSDTGEIINTIWYSTDSDIFHFNTGNCFKTKQEAEEYKENLLTKQALKDLALELNDGIEIYWDYFHQPKYYILYDYRFKELLIDFTRTRPCAPGIYCISPNFLKIAKDSIGEEKLIKLIKSGV